MSGQAGRDTQGPAPGGHDEETPGPAGTGVRRSRDISHDETLLSDAPRALPGAPGLTLPSAGQSTPPPSADLPTLDIPVARAPALNTMPSVDVVRGPARGPVKPGDILSGKYTLERVLGQGGMGKVWKGVHLGLGVPIAVKVMHSEIASLDDYARRFQREAHAASLLDHPNVVRVLDFGDDAGTLYMVMEYLDGRPLTRWLGTMDGPPPLADVARVFTMLLDALEVAHSFGIVHRDLKPDNVFILSAAAGKLGLKVVDFGLAHVDDARDQGPTLTNRDVIAGTPEYMSPEQCRSLKVGPSADIYSVGCILTDLLQLRPPFQGGSSIEVLAKQMFTHPPPLSRPAGAEAVPPLLERLRLDLLAKSAEKRPRDAADVKARLREAMSPEATEARLPTRKGDEPLGDRAARAPVWLAEPSENVPPTTRTRAGAFALLRLTREDGGVGPEVETGLSVHKLETVSIASLAELAATGLSVIVLDVGADVDRAAATLRELQALSPRCKALVCAAGLTTERMNTLVAAGAADVLRYPVSADALSRKLERVMRRGR